MRGGGSAMVAQVVPYDATCFRIASGTALSVERKYNSPTTTQMCSTRDQPDGPV